MKRLRFDPPEFTEWGSDTKTAIINAFGETSRYVKDFEAIHYTPTVSIANGTLMAQYQEAYTRGLDKASARLRSMIRDVHENWEDPQEPSTPEAPQVPQPVITNRVFVIHGRDHGTRDTVAGFLRKLGLEPVILEEQPDRGLTVIEKFEENARGDFVVALLTPDDVGGPNADELKPRARQNVIFELGYFVGKFGRDKVRALMKEDLEIPSDYSGVLYIPLDEGGGWKTKLIGEMKSAGLDIDANRAYE